MDRDKYLHISAVTRGFSKADLVLKNVNVINVFSEEIYRADIALCDGIIAGIGDYSGRQEVDLTGFFASPGFIDCHLHLESALVTPREFVILAARRGTTTFIVDPHESANVAGSAGIDYILEQTEDIRANVYVMLPSCVPASDVDDSGAVLTAKDLAPYLNNHRILGLGEVMDSSAVIEGQREMHEKLHLFATMIIDGHAPSLAPDDLSAYALAGISTDHECTDYAYAMEEVRRGITVLIREGSAARNLEAIVEGIVAQGADTSNFCFCTDDKHTESVTKDGHIDYCIRKAVALGLDPIKAIKMATVQAARCYGLRHLGAIAPGYQGDVVILDNLQDLKIHQVYHKGVLLDQEGPIEIKPCPEELKNTVHLARLSPSDLVLEKPQGPQKFPVIKVLPGQIITEEVLAELPGQLHFEPNDVHKKIAVVERHGQTGQIGIGVITSFDIRGGAVASSVSHDSHNIIVIGDNDHDIALAVNELLRTQGGYTIVEGGKVYDTLELPILGLMSEAGCDYVTRKLTKMIDKVHQMGVAKDVDPFTVLSFMALPVIPEVRITPRGVYHVGKKHLIVLSS